jgi:uncharacterized OB-fold protein
MTTQPLPVPNDIDRPFWDAAREGRLAIQRCATCGRYQHPPTVTCPACGGAPAWGDASGEGVVHTFTVFHRAYHPAFVDDLPYNVSIVRLAEGPLILSSVVGVAADELEVGMAVSVVFDRVSESITLPRFAPRAKKCTM